MFDAVDPTTDANAAPATSDVDMVLLAIIVFLDFNLFNFSGFGQ
jgi:hypothetical protein